MNAAILTQALGWSLIHSLWQGLLIGLLVFGAASSTSSSQRKYTIHCVGLFTLLLSFAGTFFRETRLTPTAEVSVTATTTITTVATHPLITTVPTAPVSTSQPSQSQFNWDKLVASLTWLWLIGIIFMTLRAALAAHQVHSLRKTSIALHSELWQTKLQSWATQLGIHKIITLATTTLNDVPATIGHFKPLILLPAAILTRLATEQIEALILHELAHIRRHDFLINALQVAGEILLFFHPIAWWLSRSIRHQRELCCDQIVAQRSGNRATYAKALLALEELRVNSPGLFAVSAAGSPLKQRIAHLLQPEASLRPQSWIISFCSLALFAGLTLAAWPQSPTQAAALAEKPEPQTKSNLTASPKTAANKAIVRAVRDGAAQFSSDKGKTWNKVTVGTVLAADYQVNALPHISAKTAANTAADTAILLEGQVFELTEDPSKRFALKNKLDSASDDISLWDLTDEEARALIDEAKTSGNTKTLASPILTTVSGRAVRIDIGAVPNDPKGPLFSVNAIGYVINKDPASQTEPVLLGQSLELLPELSKDRFIIAGKFSHREEVGEGPSVSVRTIYSAPIYVAIPNGHSVALIQKNKQDTAGRQFMPPSRSRFTVPPATASGTNLNRAGQPAPVSSGTNQDTTQMSMGMTAYIQNPELMKRYFPSLYAQMQKRGFENHLLLIISPKAQE